MPLTANFLADFSSFLNATKTSIAATKDLETAAAGVGPAVDASLQESGKAMETTVQGAATRAREIGLQIGGALKDVGAGLVGIAKGFIDEFAEGEAASARLQAALKAAGQEKGVADLYAQMAAELQKFSTFSDEAITDAQTLFTTIGNVKPDLMRESLEAAMNLATVMKTDLVSAATLLSKAAASDGEALGKLKVTLQDSLPEGAKYADVLAAIEAKMGGQFQANLETTSGKMENLKNKMSDFNEMIGGVLADNLTRLLDLFGALPEGIQTTIIAVVAIGTAIAPILGSIAALVSILGSAGLGTALAAAGAALSGILLPLAAVAAAVVAAVLVWKNWDTIKEHVQGAYEATKSWLGEKLAPVWDGMKTAITGTVNVFVAFHLKVLEVAMAIYNAIKIWLVDKLSALFNYIATLPGIVISAFQSMFNAVVGFSIVPDMIDGIASEFDRLDRVMVRPALAAADDVTRGFAAIGDTPIALPSLGAVTGGARGGAGASANGIAVTVNMSGMLGTDDPQTRAAVRELVSNALMEGMRGARLMGTA